MSQYPRRVLTDITVNWDRHANGNPAPRFVRHGAAVDIVPGSLLEAAYGAQNLGSLTLPQLSEAEGLDQSEVSN